MAGARSAASAPDHAQDRRHGHAAPPRQGLRRAHVVAEDLADRRAVRNDVDAERADEWSVGPSVTIPLPLFDFGQAQRERVQAIIIEQRHELTRSERQIVQEIRVALEQLAAAKLALAQVENRLLPLQEERLAQAQSSYRLGVADVLAVRLAEQDLQAARSQQLDLQAQVSLALFQLQRASGGPSISSSSS